MKEEKYLGMSMPLTFAMNDELKRTTNIEDFLKTPSRDKLIAIAFGMHLSGDETQKMLKISGNRELYARDARDAIILFCLQRKMVIYEANDLLDSNGFKLLGNLEE